MIWYFILLNNNVILIEKLPIYCTDFKASECEEFKSLNCEKSQYCSV